MDQQSFRAMVVTEVEEKQFVREINEKTVGELPEGDVLVEVFYSSLNYKDALSATGNRGVTKNYPHTPGIDAAGVVAQSTSDQFQPGDEVIVTSYDLGMNTSGGFGQFIRVPADWVVRLPEALTLKESMIYGTAGFTAALSVHSLLAQGVLPEQGEILVSGATGGVGSIAVSILSKIGYTVAAVNGIVDESEYLQSIGAKAVISIEDATDTSGRPLLKGRWAGGVDTVGGEILATTIKSLLPNGAATSCGNVASPELPLTVYPFILRGVTLAGIDSQNCPMPLRQKVWNQIASEWKIPNLAPITSEVTLDELDRQITMMLEQKHKGRAIVRMRE